MDSVFDSLPYVWCQSFVDVTIDKDGDFGGVFGCQLEEAAVEVSVIRV